MTDELVNEQVNKWINELTGGCINGYINYECVLGGINRWMCEWMNIRMVLQINKLTNG